MSGEDKGQEKMNVNTWELLHRHLSGETTPAEQKQVQELLQKNSEAARVFSEMEKTRAHLRRAVASQQAPKGLGDSIRQQTIGSNIAGSNILSLSTAGRRTSLRTYYAVAAAIALLIAGWFIVDRYAGEGTNPSQLADALGPAEEMLRIGMNDHLKCAVTFYKGTVPEYSMEKMKQKLGPEFAALIPVAQQKISEGKLVVAHKCMFGGRRYVHMVLKGEESMISLVITQKQEGESLTKRDGPFITVSDIPVYHTAMDGFEIAGFESGEFLVFVASNLSEESNLQVAQQVVVPVSGVLRQIQT